MTVGLPAMNSGSVAQRVRDEIANIPSSVDSGVNLQNWVEQASSQLTVLTDTTIDNANIPEQFKTILINMGCMYTLAKMLGTNVDYDMRLGEFSTVKSDKLSPEFRQLNFYINQINQGLIYIRRGSNYFSKVWGA